MKSTTILLFFLLIIGCKSKGNDPVDKPGDLPDPPKPPVASVSATNVHLVGVDHFGRSFNTITSLKSEKQVGMFFWLWIGQPFASDIWDATKILALPNGLKILTDFASLDPSISPNGQAHFWGEPLWGYYNSDDEWVIRKQLQMITLAGVDFIFFDTTNAVIYKNVFMKILAIIDEYLKNGWNPPKVIFYTHSRSIQTTRNLYTELYQPNLYPNTWYRVGGKPMIIAYTNVDDDLAEAKSRNDNRYVTEPLTDEILSFFHFLKPQWPGDPVFPDGFPWVEWIFPQPMHEKIMNVSVASHPMVPMSFSLTRPGWVNWGRGWDPDSKKNISKDVDKGAFFQRQWDQAIKANPEMISVGGWNEWIAYKQPWDGEYMLCDAANKEFSRDIEPIRGSYEDAFYIQLIKNIRKYKGVSEPAEKGKPQTINIDGDITQWDTVAYHLRNIGGDDIARSNFGAAKTVTYTQPMPENLLQDVKVTNDDKNVYFYIRCRNDFTAPEGRNNWLNILISAGEPELKSWESYDYIIGRTYDGKQASVEKLNADFSVSSAGFAKFHKAGKVIQIQMPLSVIGKADRLYFKVAAGVENPEDIMSYYTSGCAMPMGRLSYMYLIN